MCGIVTYCGNKNATEIILNGLEKLEYRGYDSAGISVITSDKLVTLKRAGKLSNLIDAVKENPFSGNIGIGHTRWATHGEPTETNAHPHFNEKKTISVVHNGIIENYASLKKELIEQGYNFVSETDTEVVVHLIDSLYDGNLLNAVVRATKKLEGSYALGVVSIDNPSELIAVRNQSPLVMGICEDGHILASDVSSIIEHTKKVVYLNDGDIVSVKLNKGYKIYDNKLNELNREIKEVEWSIEDASKEGFDHFMIKEIFEQPKAIKEALNRRIKNYKINFEDQTFSAEELKKFNKIYVVACGTAYHAAEVGKFALQKFAKLPVYGDIASEFRYNSPFIDENTLIIVVSQSGETADTLGAMREAKKYGATILAITNVVGSTVAREADKVLYCYAGPEISVASTKAYTTQLIVFYLLSLDFASKLGTMTNDEVKSVIDELLNIPSKIEQLLENISNYENIAKEIMNEESIYYIGRGIDFVTAKEGSLKLKEISYIHSEPFQAGELKHGSIALMDKGTKVIAIATQEHTVEKTASNIQELTARGAEVYSIGFKDYSVLSENSSKAILLPKTLDILAPLLSVVPAQIIAYYTSVLKGNDVDKPRNLAKSVTVE